MAEPRSLPAVRPVYDAAGGAAVERVEAERVEAELVAVAPMLPTGVELAAIQTIAAYAAKSGFFGANTVEKAAMQILAGREYGLGPWQALAGMHVINGLPTLKADMMAALVQRALRHTAGRFDVVEHTDQRCTVEGRRPEWVAAKRLTWTIADAQRAGLPVGDARSNWAKYPRAMLKARATTEAARAWFPDVVAGLYDPEEATSLRPFAGEAPQGEIPAGLNDALGEAGEPAAPPPDPDKRQLALAALHAIVADRGAPDAHAALKALQGPLHADDDGVMRDPLCFASFADAEVWTTDAIRPFYRRVRDLPERDFRRIVGLPAAGDEPEDDAGRTVDPETGEVFDGPPTDREDELAEWRRAAKACRTLDAWKQLAAGAGADEEKWLVLVAETMSAGTIDALRKLARQQGANTPAVEAAFIARRRAVQGPIEATTP